VNPFESVVVFIYLLYHDGSRSTQLFSSSFTFFCLNKRFYPVPSLVLYHVWEVKDMRILTITKNNYLQKKNRTVRILILSKLDFWYNGCIR